MHTIYRFTFKRVEDENREMKNMQNQDKIVRKKKPR